jgi:DNA repair protein RadA/Sms
MDGRRLQMLLAVLEKRAGFKLGQQDVFLNIAGGLRIEDPGLDLAICTAIVSSYADSPVPHTSCFAGEVGLGGEVRAVLKADQRVAEAARLGYKEIFISEYQKEALKPIKGITLRPVSRLTDVFPSLFS